MIINEEPYKSQIAKLQEERKVIYLTYGGSHAYGTNIEGSDIDLRGIALKTPKELLGMSNFEQFQNTETDTTIYSADKFFGLALNTNPNVIEFLGTNTEHRFLTSPEMQLVLDNKSMFLSKRAIKSFGGYATAQLRRLENALGRNTGQSDREIHIMGSLKSMQRHLQENYSPYTDDDIGFKVVDSMKDGYEKEILIDLNLKNYPLRDFMAIQSEMNQTIKNYEKLNHRNNKKSEQKLDKHVMHLIRLYLMLLDILEKGEIKTYRERDRDVLLDIRNGKWSDNNYEKLYHELSVLEKRVEYAKIHTELPNKPDYKMAEEILVEINRGAL